MFEFLMGVGVGVCISILVCIATATSDKPTEKEDPADWWKNGKKQPDYDD